MTYRVTYTGGKTTIDADSDDAALCKARLYFGPTAEVFGDQF